VLATAKLASDGATDLLVGSGTTLYDVRGIGQPDPTATGISCGNGRAVAGVAVTCTVTVTDGSGALEAPTGTVHVSSSAGGSSGFASGGACVLGASASAAATCTVSYTPPGSSVGTRADTLSASYGGDSLHAGSHASTSLSVVDVGPLAGILAIVLKLVAALV
jgi:hypothetical protein